MQGSSLRPSWLAPATPTLVIVGVLGAALAPPLGAAAQGTDAVELQYRTQDEDSGQVLDVSVTTLRRVGPASFEVHWRSESEPENSEEMLLDSTFATVAWRVRFAQEGYDYAGERVGDVLRIEGVLDDEEVSEELEIDERPFYYDWKIGLVDFVRSGEEKRRFWTFRPDNQSVHEFEAQRKEEATVTIDGRDVSAVRIEWGLNGWRRTFYKGNQWYRASDGFFLMEARDDQVVELVGESTPQGG